MTWTTKGIGIICRQCRPIQPQRLPSTTKRTTVQVTHTRPLQHDDDNQDTTTLVDGLLQYTRQLMEESDTNHHVVAYSGGVDSSLVMALLQHASSSCNSNHVVQAVLGISPAVSQEQIHQARHVASHLQVDLQEIPTTEGSSPMYIENNGQACFACKTHLYDSLSAIHDYHSFQKVQLYNGTNSDDVQDKTRVGLIAAANFNVYSPLQYTTKQNVRRAAKYLGLPNWNAAAAPCLRSRLALGMEATQSHLQMIEQAEAFVKKSLRVQNAWHEAANVRVRMLTKKRAMIEVDSELLSFIQVGKVEQAYFQSLGFTSVSAREFRTGSVAKRPTGAREEDKLVDNMAESQLVEAVL